MSKVLLYPDEFEDYQTEGDTSITFCLKELKVSQPLTAISHVAMVILSITGHTDLH